MSSILPTLGKDVSIDIGSIDAPHGRDVRNRYKLANP